MSEPYVGEIRMFAGNFAPRGWAFCDGQLLAVSQNDALFNLFGTIYGGDGGTTFGLPDLRGRIPIHAGSGPGLSPRNLGAKGGAESVTLTTQQIPSHTHGWRASTDAASTRDTGGGVLAQSIPDVYTSRLSEIDLNAATIGQTGGSRSHTNVMPFLCVHFIVSLFGIFPSRQ